MALTKDEVNHLVAYLVAWYHATRRPVPKGLAPYSGYVGVVKRRMIGVYQKAHGLDVNGTFDTATQKSLTPVDTRAKKAALALAYIKWGTEHHASFTYAQDRPIHNPAPAFLYQLPRRRDCSGFVMDAAHVGGFNPLTAFAFTSGYGNTDSLLEHLPRRPIEQLRQADLVVFSNPGHVVMITGPHATNPEGARWAASDGHQGAPEYVTLAREIVSHPGPYHGLSVD